MELAAAHGLEVEEGNVIAEFGSGSEFAGRPGLMDLLRRVEGGLVKAVVTPRLDRLTRSANSEDAQVMLQTLLDHKLRVITETDVFELGLPQDAAHWRLACGRWLEQASFSARAVTHG